MLGTNAASVHQNDERFSSDLGLELPTSVESKAHKAGVRFQWKERAALSKGRLRQPCASDSQLNANTPTAGLRAFCSRR